MSQEVQTVEAEEMGLETIIKDKLVEANITEQVIEKLKTDYLPLTINGQEDKDGYKKVVEARKECKKWRVLASKICKKGREDANKIQKKWVEKEKEVTDEIESVEKHLQKMEDEYEAEKERLDNEEKERVQKLYLERHALLSGYGAFFNGSAYILGDATIELSNVKSLDDEMFNDKVIPKFKAIFDQKESERLEKEKLQKEDEDRIEQQREQLRQQQAQLEKEKEQLRLQQSEAEKKEQERLENERKLREKERLEVLNKRQDQLVALGMKFNFQYDAYVFHDVNVDNKTELCLFNNEKWNALVEKITPVIEQRKQEAEEKRLADIEEQKKLQAKKELNQYRRQSLLLLDRTVDNTEDLSDLTDEQWEERYSHAKSESDRIKKEKWEKEQQEIKEQEEKRQQEILDNAKDKEKWAAVVEHLKNTPDVDMRSSQYRTKMKAVKDFLQTIK
jgi:hypothetical protein